jgi:hypothetical protein
MKQPRKHTDAEVADYWLTHDSADEIDWKGPRVRLEFHPHVENRHSWSRCAYRGGSFRS